MNLCSSLSFLFLYFFLFVFYLFFLLFVSSRHPSPESFPCNSLGQTGVGIESRVQDCQAFFTHTHAHGHTHTHLPLGTQMQIATRPSLYFSHTPLEQAFGQMQIRPERRDAADSVLWNPSGWLRVIAYNCLLSAGPALVKAPPRTHQCLPHKNFKERVT